MNVLGWVSRTILLVALPGAVAAAPTISGCPVFPANNIWNTRVDTLPVHPKSAAYVTSIGANTGFHMDFGSGLYPDPPDQDAAPIGIPFVPVLGSQATVPVRFTLYGDESDSAPGVPAIESPPGTFKGNYPIPPNAPIEGVGNPLNDGDRHVLVIDTTNCILYETGNSFPISNGASWEASGGAIFDLKVNGPLRPAGWTSADAAGLPIFPGLVRFEEANAGLIEHALRFTANLTQRAYVWPATHFASASTDTNLPPMGMRFRLKKDKDISGFNPRAKAIAQAMKTYGIILADNGSDWFVSGAPNEGWSNSELQQVNTLKGSDFEAVDVSSLMVSPTSGQVKQATAITTIVSSLNPANLGNAVTFTVTVTGAGGTPTGTVAFVRQGSPISGCGAVATAAGTASCTTSSFSAGGNTVLATYSGDAIYAGSAAVELIQVVQTGAPLLTANPATLAFSGQSINTTSPSQTTTITNNSGASVTITQIFTPQGYTASQNCVAALANGASCILTLTFTPNVQGGMNNFLAITYAGGGPTTVALTGTGEFSLVTHYYRSILRRAPDAGGKTYWEGEATRVAGLGASINETWFAMAQAFYFSAEYAAFNRTNTGYVTDLYNTFFNRAPDTPGLNFWVGQLDSGLPREVALASFMFSTEFANFTTAIFGNVTARAEVNAVVDFYRGLLARTPDDGGFAFWVGRFRTAQCQGQAAITNEVEQISSAYATSTEYTARNRTNAQYVGDLYNAFLRRGGDLGGVNFWIGQLSSAAQTREQVRVQFKNSTEFQARVNAIIAQGCL